MFYMLLPSNCQYTCNDKQYHFIPTYRHKNGRLKSGYRFERVPSEGDSQWPLRAWWNQARRLLCLDQRIYGSGGGGRLERYQQSIKQEANQVPSDLEKTIAEKPEREKEPGNLTNADY